MINKGKMDKNDWWITMILKRKYNINSWKWKGIILSYKLNNKLTKENIILKVKNGKGLYHFISYKLKLKWRYERAKLTIIKIISIKG